MPRTTTPGISRRTLLLGAATATATAALARAAPTPAYAAARTPKVLVIGLDGTLLAKIGDAEAPRIKALMAAGLTAPSSIYARPMAHTVSGPGWSTLLTGVWPDKHHVRDNTFSGHDFARYPDFLTRIETVRPELSTYAVTSWVALTETVFSSQVDTRFASLHDERDIDTTRRAADQLTGADPDAVFVQFNGVDHAGHAHGAVSQEYLDAIHDVDGLTGQLLDAIASRATYGAEDWLIIATTDHGHTDVGGHGGSSWAERQTFMIAAGGTVTAGSTRHDVKMPDVAATALTHLGVAIDPAWELDGRPIQRPAPDDFDTLRAELTASADATGAGPGALSHTHTPPSGWSVDNSAMGIGGVSEWRGWSFTTDESWTGAGRDQQRECNVRARDIFAVADDALWSGQAPGTTGTTGTTGNTATIGAFDSTLISPDYPVTGGRTATLTYTTFYRQVLPQKGEVLVSYDDGAPALVKTYTADVPSRTETVSLSVPRGVTRAKVRFRYTGGTHWFWTIDGVKISGS
ncbi:alkaline phosphatase family protein [Streptomyces sp. NPDC102467]|uniref:alkaline phosphatase family protein n=1 Tax=Streptomyces sp. NPDC102467 TaxID=3366179 RepID=UPI0038184FFC